jgi:lipopolysaccharide transport system ATP-binding protein
VRVTNEDGKIVEAFDIRRPINVEIEYDVLQPGYILLPHFNLDNELGQCAFISVDLSPAWRNRPRPTGNYISRAKIPGNFLAEGMMHIGCHCLTLNPDTVQFTELNMVSFLVTDSIEGDSARGDYARKMPGIVRPILNWNTNLRSSIDI